MCSYIENLSLISLIQAPIAVTFVNIFQVIWSNSKSSIKALYWWFWWTYKVHLFDTNFWCRFVWMKTFKFDWIRWFYTLHDHDKCRFMNRSYLKQILLWKMVRSNFQKNWYSQFMLSMCSLGKILFFKICVLVKRYFLKFVSMQFGIFNLVLLHDYAQVNILKCIE